ncbi:cobalamin biosynthesis protein [Methanocaldococcus indicus]|uniref:cobalamin biosynthesis protein n=1 Tax=Methanocaldococcus indicus TaxID=213231 RepID=UPI003C6D85AE
MIKIIYIVDDNLAKKIKEILEFFNYPSEIFNIKEFEIEGNEEGFIFISAIGIVIRKYIDKIKKDKFTDPFVIVANEKKEFIPILSNHLGRGNYFAKLLANYLNGKVIFTTATDTHNKVGLDELTNILYLEKPKREDILKINKKILFEDVNIKIPHYWRIKKIDGYIIEYHNKNYVLVDNYIKLNPLKIVVGVGCRKNIKEHKVYWLIKKALFLRNLESWRVDAFSSISIKRDELGLINAINKLNKEILFFDNNELNNIVGKYNLNKNDFVYKNTGAFSVSEASALLGVEKLSKNKGKLLLKKIKKDGVSVSIAIEDR